LSKFILISGMKCQASTVSLLVVLSLVSSGSGERETKVRQRSGRKIADVSDLQARGVSCRSKGQTFCHANVIRQYGSTYGQICSNGDIVLMRMPVGYTGPKICNDEGVVYCPGVIPGSESTFVEQWCVEGEIFYINKLTGNKYKKGRLSASKKNKDKKSTTSVEKEVKPSSTTTTTIATTITSRSTTRTSTTTTPRTTTTPISTTRSLKRSTTTTTEPTFFDEIDYNELDVYDNEVDETEEESDDVGAEASDVKNKEPSFTVEYVNTVLEESVPNVKGPHSTDKVSAAQNIP